MSKEQERHANELARLAKALNSLTQSCMSLRGGSLILEQLAALYQASLSYDAAKAEALKESL